MLGSENIFDQALGLILTSGTRIIELLSKNTFEIDPNDPKNILVGNLAKKRETQEDKDKIVSRQVLELTPIEFIEGVKRLRLRFITEDYTLLDDQGQILKSISAKLNKSLQTFFPGSSPKLLRKLWANITYKMLPNKETINKNVYLANVLGHDPSSLDTSFSYSTVGIK